MTTNSTPSTEQVREAYATRMSPAQDTLRRPMFDRWLASVKAEAWDEGHSWGWRDAHHIFGVYDKEEIFGPDMRRREDHPNMPNPYRKGETDGNSVL